MSGLSSLLDKVQRSYARVAEVEAVAARFPGDMYVLGNLSSLRRDAEKLERMWQDEASRAQLEVCRYRVVPQSQILYPIRDIGRSMVSFQDLFSQLYDSIVAGKKSKKAITEEITGITSLNFGFAYPGSLGIAMTVPSDRDLFTNRYDEVIVAFLGLMRLASEGEVRKIADAHGIADHFHLAG